MFIKIKNKLLNSIKKINDSYEFKPLLSEIEEAPVSPLGRFTFWTLVALIVVTTLWLFIGQVDIVVNARGIIVPDGDAKIIQPLDTGVVRQILIKEGDFVKKGQLLIAIDTSTTDAQLQTVNKNLEQSKLEAQRLKASGNGEQFNSSNNETIEEFEVQKKLYEENLLVLKSSIGAKEQEIVQLNRQIDLTIAQKRDYEFQLKNAQEREKRLANVIDIIAYNQYEEAREKLNSLKEAVNRSEAEIGRLQSQKRQIQDEIAHVKADFRSQNLTTFSEVQKRINELQANKEQIEFSNINQKITAPCDGYIDKLLIHTIGGIVTPAQELIALTPIETPMLIKAQVLNKDIGFIRVGMPVSIKENISRYDFKR